MRIFLELTHRKALYNVWHIVSVTYGPVIITYLNIRLWKPSTGLAYALKERQIKTLTFQ